MRENRYGWQVRAGVLLMLCAAMTYARGTGKIVGRVTDHRTGARISSAAVEIKHTDLRATTDVQGHYEIDYIPAGIRALSVTCPGYKDTLRTGLFVIAGQTLAVDLALEPLAPDTAAQRETPADTPLTPPRTKVYSPDTVARRRVYSADSTGTQTGISKTVRPGSFIFSSGTTKPDTFRLADTLPLAPRLKSKTYSADRDTQWTVTGGLRGTVSDRTGRHRIAGATVKIEGTLLIARTGTDGNYQLRAVPAGRPKVTVRADGYAPADTSIVINPGLNQTLNFRLRPTGGRFTGRHDRRHGWWEDWAWWRAHGHRRHRMPLEWIQTYPGSWVAAGFSVTATRDGGYAAAGITLVPQGENRAYLVKTLDDGRVQWEKFIDIDSLTGISSVETTDRDGYVLLGTSRFGAWVIETDSLGNRVLDEYFDEWKTGPAARAIRVRDGGYLVWQQGARLAKYDSAAWHERTLDIPQAGPEDDGLDEERLLALRDKGWLIHGRGLHYVKLDSLWRLKWSRDFSEGYSAVGLSVRQTEDFGFIVAGRIRSLVPGREEDVYLVKTDSLGRYQWERVYGDSGMDQGNCVVPVHDGGFVIVCDVGATDTSPGFGQIMKTDSLGYPRWTITLKDPGTARSVQETRDGGLIVVGTLYESGLPCMYLMKLDREETRGRHPR